MLGFDLIDSEQLCVDHNRPSQNERPLRIHPRKTNYRSLPPIIGSNEFFKLIQESETESKPTVSSINSSHKDDFLDEHLEGYDMSIFPLHSIFIHSWCTRNFRQM